MTLKSLALGSVAAIALAGAFAQVPANAYEAEERVQTQQLNSQQLQTPSAIPAYPPDAGYRGEPMRPTPVVIRGQVALDALPDPERTLANRVVENDRGQPMGTVTHVILDEDGRAVAVDVNLAGYVTKFDRIVSIDADEFVYDGANDVLVTRLSKSQLRYMPRAYPES